MYQPKEDRYQSMRYRRCGNSGVMLPLLSLGLWHNFGGVTPFAVQQSMLRTAFDLGITHFDLANNYGPPYGEAEANFGRLMDADWRPHRDELFLSTKAGYDMWPGPYGDHGSRKYLIASIDQSLKRMRVDYVDVFYHHRPDPDTPIEETMAALDHIVRSGKALYAGISNYGPEQAKAAIQTLRRLGTPCLIHQPSYSMLNRWIEDGLTDVLRQERVGCIVFAPLANGLLTGKYLDGIPADSRMAKDGRYLRPESLTDEKLEKIRALKKIADGRGQKLHHLALQWVLRDPVVTSALIGASRPEQIADNVQALSAPPLTEEELRLIEEALR
ncbi:MAG: L-glyceraldehyde 3-phosphate reductase [Clostridia bacterium]|nr:L-glyceraldehyde 3-phosphate reductase [Clostridia bacterium]